MMTPSVAPTAAPIVTPGTPPISPLDAPTAAPLIRPNPAPAATLPLRLGVPGFNPAASAFCCHATTSSFAASRPCSWNFAFDRNIGSGPAQAARLRTKPVITMPRNFLNPSPSSFSPGWCSLQCEMVRLDSTAHPLSHTHSFSHLVTGWQRDGRISFYCAPHFSPAHPSTPRRALYPREHILIVR